MTPSFTVKGATGPLLQFSGMNTDELTLMITLTFKSPVKNDIDHAENFQLTSIDWF
jgi:hypothetical protein